jgi:streptogramin lyase
VTEDSIVRIDPETGQPVAAVSAGPSPTRVAAGEGAVWLVTTGDRRLSRVDPETNQVVASVDFPPGIGESPQEIVAGEGAVWTLYPSGILKYDPATNTFPPLPDNVELASDHDDIVEDIGFGSDIATGDGAVWVSAGHILRLDPETGEVLERITPSSYAAPASGVGWLAVDDGGVWNASQEGGVFFIEFGSNLPTLSEDVSDALAGIAVGEGAVWAMNAADDSILRIDPATGRVTGTVRVGRLPTAVAAGAGAVWVTSGRDGTLTRIDPITFNLDITDLGGTATDVVVGEGAVWATVDVR